MSNSNMKAALINAKRGAELLTEASKKNFGKNWELHKRNYTYSVKAGKKYIKLDAGTSGKYMVEVDTGNIYGIKAYGVINKNQYFGNIDDLAKGKIAIDSSQSYAPLQRASKLKKEVKKEAVKKETLKGKSKLKSIEILWAEGDNSNYDNFPKKYTSFESANKAALPIYNDYVKNGSLGYNKTKYMATWEDGSEYSGRLDVSESEGNPMSGNAFGKRMKEVLGSYLTDSKAAKETVDNAKKMLTLLEFEDKKQVKTKVMAKKKAPAKKAATAKRKAPVKAKKEVKNPAVKVKSTRTRLSTEQKLASSSDATVLMGCVELASKCLRGGKDAKADRKVMNQSDAIRRALKNNPDKAKIAKHKKSLKANNQSLYVDLVSCKNSAGVKKFFNDITKDFKASSAKEMPAKLNW